MKRSVLLLVICSVLALSACAGDAGSQNGINAAPSDSPEPSEPVLDISLPQTEESAPMEADYFFENKLESNSFVLTDGGEAIAYYSYSFPVMFVSNIDDLAESDSEIAWRNVNAFNTEMLRVLADAVSFGESMGEELLLSFEEEGQDWVGCDEKEASITRAGEIISVHAKCHYYGGGAHPYSYSVSYTFDLSLGQFIDPAQIGDDPEAFRIGVAALLIEQAEGLDESYTEGYWSDYRDIISNWNDTTVLFDENGMTVLFSAYELGPYAMGPVELTLSYDEMAEALGPGGLSHLGVAK